MHSALHAARRQRRFLRQNHDRPSRCCLELKLCRSETISVPMCANNIKLEPRKALLARLNADDSFFPTPRHILIEMPLIGVHSNNHASAGTNIVPTYQWLPHPHDLHSCKESCGLSWSRLEIYAQTAEISCFSFTILTDLREFACGIQDQHASRLRVKIELWVPLTYTTRGTRGKILPVAKRDE